MIVNYCDWVRNTETQGRSLQDKLEKLWLKTSPET